MSNLDEDLFGDEFIETSQGMKQEVEEVEEVEGISETISTPSHTYSQEGSVPQVRGTDFPREYMEMVERLQVAYQSLPSLNYSDIYEELAELNIKSQPALTLQIINDELQKIQGSKDRLSEIFLSIHQCFSLKKRAVDILLDSWAKYASEKSADKRKGDATFRLSNFIVDLAITEALLKACNHVLKNLDSAHERLSRTITIWQLEIKLGDFGRGGLSEVDLSKAIRVEDDFIQSTNKEVDITEGIIPELQEDF